MTTAGVRYASPTRAEIAARPPGASRRGIAAVSSSGVSCKAMATYTSLGVRSMPTPMRPSVAPRNISLSSARVRAGISAAPAAWACDSRM